MSRASHLGRSAAILPKSSAYQSSERMQCAAIRTRTRRSGSHGRPRQDRRRWRSSRRGRVPTTRRCSSVGRSARPSLPRARCAFVKAKEAADRAEREAKEKVEREAREKREAIEKVIRDAAEAAERKAERDRRYAARKARQGRR